MAQLKSASFSPVGAARAAWHWVRTSARITHWLFGVDSKRRVYEDLWDTTSIALREAIRRYVHAGDQVLELGTGHMGVLSIYCAKRRGARVVAVDINQRYLDNAAEVARESRAPTIEFLYSDWFANLADRKFDVIFGNIPYVPSAVGEQIGMNRERRRIWDGGEDGSAQLRIILRDASGHLTRHGRLLLGVNTMYLPRTQTLALIRATPSLKFESIVRVQPLPSEVYVVSSSDHGSAEG